MVLNSNSDNKAASTSSSSSASPCAELKSVYHDCFNRWYSEKFSKGQWDKEECVAEWDKYRACLAFAKITRKGLSGRNPTEINAACWKTIELEEAKKTIG